MNKSNIFVAVDYDNSFYMKTAFDKKQLIFLMNILIDNLIKYIGKNNYYKIYLYGGWYDDQAFTKNASKISMAFGENPMFPRIDAYSKTRGTVELAAKTRTTNQILYNTYVKRKRLYNIYLSDDRVDCYNNSKLCKIRAMRNIFNKGSHHCESENKDCNICDVYETRQQKMVDTMIVCDIIKEMNESNFDGIVLVSDDLDFIPLLIYLSYINNKKEFMYLCKNEETIDILNKYLTNLNKLKVRSYE